MTVTGSGLYSSFQTKVGDVGVSYDIDKEDDEQKLIDTLVDQNILTSSEAKSLVQFAEQQARSKKGDSLTQNDVIAEIMALLGLDVSSTDEVDTSDIKEQDIKDIIQESVNEIFASELESDGKLKNNDNTKKLLTSITGISTTEDLDKLIEVINSNIDGNRNIGEVMCDLFFDQDHDDDVSLGEVLKTDFQEMLESGSVDIDEFKDKIEEEELQDAVVDQSKEDGIDAMVSFMANNFNFSDDLQGTLKEMLGDIITGDKISEADFKLFTAIIEEYLKNGRDLEAAKETVIEALEEKGVRDENGNWSSDQEQIDQAIEAVKAQTESVTSTASSIATNAAAAASSISAISEGMKGLAPKPQSGGK